MLEHLIHGRAAGGRCADGAAARGVCIKGALWRHAIAIAGARGISKCTAHLEAPTQQPAGGLSAFQRSPPLITPALPVPPLGRVHSHRRRHYRPRAKEAQANIGSLIGFLVSKGDISDSDAHNAANREVFPPRAAPCCPLLAALSSCTGRALLPPGRALLRVARPPPSSPARASFQRSGLEPGAVSRRDRQAPPHW